MPLRNKVAVIGGAVRSPVKGHDKALEELLYDVVQDALTDAGLTIEQIDGIVVAGNDQFDGRAISVMAASGSVGGVDRDILSTPSAAEHAFVLGVLRTATGQYRTQLVVAWSPTEVSSLSEAERLEADPYFHRRLPLDSLSSYALQASALIGAVPEIERAAIALNGAATSRPSPSTRRWPLADDMISPPVTGAVALVLASEEFIAENKNANPAWIRGMGWATEPGFLGDRDLARAPALEAAARRAYDEAGVTAPEETFDLAEVHDATPYQQLLALEALGLSKRSRWDSDIATGRFAIGGDLPVNPSGGSRAANAVFCNGLIRIAEAANQIRGRAAKHQVEDARMVLAHAASGFAMQYQTVIVLARDH
jgi:acetyl-CoA C-acetyltransferase